MHKIEKKLKDFQKRLELNPLLKSHYLTVMRKIWESELMPEATLISLAKKVKPLIRLDKSMNSKCVDYERPSFCSSSKYGAKSKNYKKELSSKH